MGEFPKLLPVQVETIHLPQPVQDEIARRAKKEKKKGGYESVGFLVGHTDTIVGLVPLNNHASNPTEAFFVEPWEQYRAERKIEADGYTIMGVYHSHVNGEALPSQSDHKWARPNELAVIYSVMFQELRAFRELDGILLPVEIDNTVEEADEDGD